MAETFQSFHAQGAQESESILGLPFAWGSVTFSGVLAPAAIVDDPVSEPGAGSAEIIKARASQFTGSVYPKTGAIITGTSKRYRAINDAEYAENDPFITIPVVEIPTS